MKSPKKRSPKKKPQLRPCARALAALRERIAKAESAGEVGASLGSEVELARACRVSRMTVRKAVDILVSEGLVERRAGVGLFARVEGMFTRAIRLVVCNLAWDSSMQIALALRNESRAIGTDVQIRDAGGDDDAYIQEIRNLKSADCDGAIVLALHLPGLEDAIREVADSGMKIVVIDKTMEGIPCVVSDNVKGGALVARALQKAGHTHVAFLGDLVADTVTDRARGFRDYSGWGGAKVEILDQRDFGAGRDWELTVSRMLAGISARPIEERPTAIFCSCDAVARVVYRELEKMGRKIPEEISIVGFDDDPISEWVRPALTTVRQDFPAIGSAALRALHSGTGAVVPVSFVARNSVVHPAK